VDGSGTGFCLLSAMVKVRDPFRTASGGGRPGGGTSALTRKYFDPRLDFVRYW
jgi:hypothetical protein